MKSSIVNKQIKVKDKTNKKAIFHMSLAKGYIFA
jgi:hypothetical protein